MTLTERRFKVRVHELGRSVDDRFWTRMLGWLMLFYILTSPFYCFIVFAMVFDWRMVVFMLGMAAIPLPIAAYFIHDRERTSHRELVMFVDEDDFYFNT